LIETANDEEGVVDRWVSIYIFTGSIARSAKRQYLNNSEADFEVFHLQGRHFAPMGVKLSIDCKKTATGNGNLQQEIEINESSSSKKLLE